MLNPREDKESKLHYTRKEQPRGLQLADPKSCGREAIRRGRSTNVGLVAVLEERLAGSASRPPGRRRGGAPGAHGRLRRESGGPRGWSAARPTGGWASRSARPVRRQRPGFVRPAGLFAGQMQGLPTTMPATPNRRARRARERRSSRGLRSPLQGQHRLRGQAQLVGDGDADAGLPTSRAEIAR